MSTKKASATLVKFGIHESKAIPTEKSDFEPSPETQALLKILELGNQDMAAGRVKRVVDVITRLRTKRFSAS